MTTMEAFVEAVNTRHAEAVTEYSADAGMHSITVETFTMLAYGSLAAEVEALPNKLAPVAHVLAVVLEWERAKITRCRIADQQNDRSMRAYHDRVAEGYAGAIGIVKSKLVVSGVRVGMSR